MNWNKVILVLAFVSILVMQTGCIGPFNLTKQVHHWNSNVGVKWANEGIFLLFCIIPVYGVTLLGDAIIFNSIEFWGGDNPIDAPIASNQSPADAGPALAGYATPVEDGYVVWNGENGAFVPYPAR
jgi:hypothetical protein